MVIPSGRISCKQQMNSELNHKRNTKSSFMVFQLLCSPAIEAFACELGPVQPNLSSLLLSSQVIHIRIKG